MEKLIELQSDLSTPFYIKNLIFYCLDKDIVDVVSALELVTNAFKERLEEIKAKKEAA